MIQLKVLHFMQYKHQDNQNMLPGAPNPSVLITMHYPGLPKLKCILREGFHVLSSNPTINISWKKPSLNFCRPTNLHLILTSTCHCPCPLPPQQDPSLVTECIEKHAPSTSSSSPNANLLPHHHCLWLQIIQTGVPTSSFEV